MQAQKSSTPPVAPRNEYPHCTCLATPPTFLSPSFSLLYSFLSFLPSIHPSFHPSFSLQPRLKGFLPSYYGMAFLRLCHAMASWQGRAWNTNMVVVVVGGGNLLDIGGGVGPPFPLPFPPPALRCWEFPLLCITLARRPGLHPF